MNHISTQDLITLKNTMDEKYYNTGNSPLDDTEYDLIVDTLKQRVPTLPLTIGATVSKNRVALPVWMGSANKFTPQTKDAMMKWQTKFKSPYIVSEKLDGVSCLYQKIGNSIKLFTRGDGHIGSDISHLLSYLSLPSVQSSTITIRGELLISKHTFETKYTKLYKNSRNMVTGLLGTKTTNPAWNDLHFVAYEVIDDTPLLNQLATIAKVGFRCVKYNMVNTLFNLSSLLKDFKEKSTYELDGIIIHSSEPYIRNTQGNPEYMFAFKMLEEQNIHMTVVERVEWEISKWGTLKPVVLFQPIQLKDVTLTRATAHNARYVVDNKLGKGAIIRITRSNDVIPYIVDVIKSTQPDLPERYTWDDTKVNITTVEDTEDMYIKQIADFFSQLNIKYVSEATVTKLYKNKLDTLYKIISADLEQFKQILGGKTAERAYTNIHKGLQGVTLSSLVGASGTLGFGMGKRRVEMLLTKIPDLFTKKTVTQDEIQQVEGFSELNSKKVVDNLSKVKTFLEQINPFVSYDNVIKNKINICVVFSGFRNKELENKICSMGGSVSETVSKKTNIVLVKDKTVSTGKTEKAINLNIPIMTVEQFTTNYL